MAENESLDLGRSLRWRSVSAAVSRGDSVEEVAHAAIVSTVRTIKKVQEEIPFDELFDIAHSTPDSLPAFARHHDGHDFAKLMGDVGQLGVGRDRLPLAFISAIVEKFLDQILYKAVPSPRWPSFQGCANFLNQVRATMEPGLRKIAAALSVNPRRRPRVPSVYGRPTPEARTAAMMTQSILREN